MIAVEQPYIVVVSGLPRTGTSMMMRALAAGGMPVLVDEHRAADADNPGGYYELERVKQLRSDSTWLSDAQSKAVKIIYRLLYDLPACYRYKVIFMQRRLEEVIASQKVMLSRRKTEGSGLNDRQLLDAFRTELAKVSEWMEGQDHMEVMHVDYRDAIDNPVDSFRRINEFLGGEMDVGSMIQVVDPSLYRNRAERSVG